MKPFARWLFPALVCAACCFSCKDQGALSDFSTVPDPLARWKAYNIHSYVIREQRTCFCADGHVIYEISVTNDVISAVTSLDNGAPVPADQWGRLKTIDQLFDLVASITPGSVAAFSVDYDSKFGYPASVYVDPNANIADEEYGYSVSLFTAPGR